MLDARIAFCSKKDHPEFLLQEKRSVWRSRKPRKKIGSFAEEILHDLRLLPGYWRSWHRSCLRWSTYNYSSRWWCSGIRYEIPGKCVHIENTRVWPVQNRIGIVWHGNSSEDIEARLSEIENDGEVKHRSETRIAKLWRQTWELKQEQWLRIEGVNVVLKEDKESAINGKQKGQCSRGDKCSFGHDEDKRAKPTPKTAPPSEPPTQRGKSASRKKNPRGWSPSGNFAQQQCKNYLKCICTKSPYYYWHLPECHSINLNRE